MEDPSQRLKNLVLKANDFEVDSKIPAFRYLRSSREMERMALVYSSENQYENGFLLFMKLITLLVEKLPSHPHYKDLTPDQRKQLKQRCKTALSAAEKLKQNVRRKYEDEFKLWEQAEEKRKKKEAEEHAKAIAALSIQHDTKTTTTSKDTTKTVGLPTPPTPSTSNDFSADAYPSIPQVAKIEQQSLFPQIPQTDKKPTESFYPSVTPSAPPPEYAPPSYDEAVPGEIKTTIPMIDRSNKPVPITASQYTPQINRDTKPQDALFRQVSDSLDGNRRIIIPADLVPRFLQVVAPNTNRNVETCGILNGTLSHHTLRVTHLVIPKQTATSDSCTTENEEELFDVQDKYDTITLGWIHTHPSQTAFLSSVDLHTQCSYQQLMPEAIAIVCAPKYNTTGIFRLTPHHGLKFVASCTKSGFHPHPKNPPLFEDSPLVATDGSARIQIIDLRT